MKKLIIAAMLYVATVGAASAGIVDLGPFGTQIFVRGSFNSFGLANPMAYDGAGTYSATISLGAGSYEFKIASEDWSTIDLGNIDGAEAFAPPATVNAARTSFGNFALDILTAGDYVFSLDVSSLLPIRGPGNPFDGPFPLTVRAAVVPVPAAGLLLLSALGGLGFLRRRS